MASPITVGGLASGLDTNAIIAALKGVEGRKVSQLQKSRQGFSRKISAYDDLLARMRKLEDSLDKLADSDRFLAHKSTLPTGAEDFFAATPAGSAQAGNFQVAVSAVAKSTFLRSDGFAAPTTDLGITGLLSLQIGATQVDITIDGTNSTLAGVRDAINAAGADVTASTVFDGTDWHLELRGKETGVANAVTVLAEPSQPPPLGPVLNLTQLRAASDAAFTIDGQAYTSASNTVTDALQGVTLQLLNPQAAGAAAIQLTIAEDFTAIETQLKDFVENYNAVFSFLGEQSKARANNDEEVKPLAGEGALRNLRSSLGTLVSSEVQGLTGYTSFSTIGLSSNRDGSLTLDSARLQEALADDLDTVKKMVSDPVSGIAEKLRAAVEARTDTVDGTIKLRKRAFEQSMTVLDRQILKAEESLDVYETSLRRKYAAMESLVGRLQQQGNALAAIGSAVRR